MTSSQSAVTRAEAERGQAVDDRHLADEFAGPPDREDHLATLAHQIDFDAAAVDQIGARAGIALGEEQGPRGQRNPIERSVHGRRKISARSMREDQYHVKCL